MRHQQSKKMMIRTKKSLRTRIQRTKKVVVGHLALMCWRSEVESSYSLASWAAYLAVKASKGKNKMPDRFMKLH